MAERAEVELEVVKRELFADQVFVFTPEGDQFLHPWNNGEGIIDVYDVGTGERLVRLDEVNEASPPFGRSLMKLTMCQICSSDRAPCQGGISPRPLAIFQAMSPSAWRGAISNRFAGGTGSPAAAGPSPRPATP